MSETKSQFCVKALVVLFTMDDDEGDDAKVLVEGNNDEDDKVALGSIDCGLLALDVLEYEIDDRGNC